MARIAVNALPTTNFSGRRVLLGHLRNLADVAEFVLVVHSASNKALPAEVADNVIWLGVEAGGHWAQRAFWERRHLDAILCKHRVQRLISLSGALTPGVSCPQWVLAQNPWAFFPGFHSGPGDRLKAAFQRRGYRQAQRNADCVFYLSDYMRQTYENNADGVGARDHAISYVGVDQEIWSSSTAAPEFSARAERIVCVSVMTPHKAIEDLIMAFARLVDRRPAAELQLVGPWAEPGYRAKIVELIQDRGVTGQVTIRGQVNSNELIAAYRQARVFCLLSRCESFGIPAIEAQVFGTPSVVANVCAPPEVAGPGGVIVEPGDIQSAADCLEHLLVDKEHWSAMSLKALANAERFRWNRVSEPIVERVRRLAA